MACSRGGVSGGVHPLLAVRGEFNKGGFDMSLIN